MCESYNIQYCTNFISVMPTNLYGPNDNYNLETSHVLPALIRKMHLGKCLENRDWEALRRDLKKYPIEEVNDTVSETVMVGILAKFGIQYSNDTRHTAPQTSNPVTITLWGTGSPYREFLHVDDLAEACVFLMQNVNFSDLCALRSAPCAPSPLPSALSSESRALCSVPCAEIKNTHINIGTGHDITIKELAHMIKSIVGFNGQLNWDNSKPDGTFRKLLDVSKINRLGWKEKIGLEEGIKLVYNKYF